MSATTFVIWNTALPAVVFGHHHRERQVYVLIPDDVAHQNEMMSPVVTE